MGIKALIAAAVDGANPADTDAEVARGVMRDTRAPRRWADLFLPLVADAVLFERRQRVRQAMRRPSRRVLAGVDAPRWTDEQRRWTADELQQPFRLGRGGDPIPWGEATVEQHLARNEYLITGFINPMGAEVARHDEAIHDILAAGVTRLNELPEEEVA